MTDYIPVQRPMPWINAREFCQKHYVDLAVLSTEEQYFTVREATASNKVSYWLGLQCQSPGSSWKWVNGEELGYKQWYNSNYEGRCASLEAMVKKDEKLLPRLCNEPHMALCQGPVSPPSVTVNSVRAHDVNLGWNVSSVMQMTPHTYNVTICTNACESRLYSHPGGSALMNIDISNLTSCTEYSVAIAAFVVRPDNRTGKEIILQDDPTTLKVKTGDSHDRKKILCLLLKLLKLVSLAPPVWVLYQIFKKDAHECLEPDPDISPVLITEE